MTQGEYMRRARQKAGMTAAKLAELSGVSRETIHALECGRVRYGRLDNIMLLADALGLSIDEYVGHKVRKRENG